MRPATKLAGAAVIAVTALALSACSSPSSPPTTKAAAGSVDLRMTTWTADPTQLALFASIADDYKKTHPEIGKITFDSLPAADYTTTLTTQIAGGQQPDLAWVMEADAPDFVSSGVLAPLSDTLKSTKGYDYSDISSDATKLWTTGGQLYAYPFSTSPFVMFANDDILAAAGEPTSAELKAQGKWNWKDLAEIGQQVNQKTGKQGIVIRDFDYVTWSNLATVWASFGAAPWSADGKTCTFTSKKMQDAFTYLHNAIFQQKAFPGPGTKADFFAGDSAFTVTQISRATLLTDAFKWDMQPLPEGPDGQQNVIGQAGVGVLAKGKNADEAKQFLAFFTNPSNAKQLAQYFPPPRTSLLNVDTLSASNKTLSKQQIQDAVLPSFTGAITKPSHTSSAEIAAKVKTALDPMWQAGADVPAVLQGVCTAIKPLLGS
ncbi:ABC transporter substrate-binding protein [Leifsonia poae]|uniref:ABC transporter substrate-binding protein n=1 Tax=Leifsonia poae TaxID=110933 RepID=UPI001CBB4636|nr:sugar ABC transporter substrate-binding protein [Leifsonia poae]